MSGTLGYLNVRLKNEDYECHLAMTDRTAGRFSMCANHTDVAQKSRAVHFKTAEPSAALDDSSVDPDQWVRFIDSGAAQQVVNIKRPSSQSSVFNIGGMCSKFALSQGKI